MKFLFFFFPKKIVVQSNLCIDVSKPSGDCFSLAYLVLQVEQKERVLRVAEMNHYLRIYELRRPRVRRRLVLALLLLMIKTNWIGHRRGLR